MKLLLVVGLLFVLTPAIYAVGNVVEDDISILQRAGFRFENVEFSPSGKSVRFTLRIPRSYDFGELGKKSFVRAACIKSEDADAKGPRLIGHGTRFPLVHKDEDVGHSLTISVLVSEAAGRYLEFCFHQRSGDPIMLVHVPLESVVAYLGKITKAEPQR